MKDCLLIANSNAVTYKEVFPLIKNNQLRWGYNWVKTFIDTEGNEKPFGNICWFVTLPTTNKKKLVLTQSYDPEKYPKYDNYDAINIDKIKDIPYNYDGPMGVPITILQYDLENVELIRFRKGDDNRDLKVNGDDKYFRVLIKKNFEITGEEVIHNKDTKIEGKEKYRRVLIKKNFEVVGMAAGAREITGIPYTGNIPGPFIGGGQSMQECLYARYQVVDAKNNPWTKGNPIYKRVIIRKKGNEKSDKQRNSRMDSERTIG